MKFQIIFSRNARKNLSEIEDYIAARSGEQRAEDFLKAIRQTCLNLDTFPQRGRLFSAGSAL
ncbi:type II toxin-antitoxin system RelE/ParE family toxin [Niveispirillum sp. KHB5.9]|uniref:type II toxin-antitoxin system RelE/ParE family toxin n=1 Tax=Niveispirillum sp. KHB5.9 TaxID=3400269 RepID=UPI003A878E1A